MRQKRRVCSWLLCFAMLLSVFGNCFTAQAADVIQNPGEAWNSYLDRVYQARKAEFDALRAANADNLVPAEEVWTLNAMEEATDADGNGLVDVYKASQLRWALVNKKSLELKNDVDLGGRNGVNWSPVADPGNIIIEGNGQTIYNMNCEGGAYVGFISSVAEANSAFKMQNIRFRYCYTRATGQYSGTVIGWMRGGQMKQVSVEDSVLYGAAHTGGIVSGWSGTGDGNLQSFVVKMDQCHVRNITVYGTSCVGSFVGPVSGYKITNSYGIDSYDISTSSHSGGFVSCPGYCWVENCFTNVKLYCNSDGGVFSGIGHYVNHFENCFAAGVVEGTSSVGGFFGRDEQTTDTCVNCYSTSMVGMQSTASNMGGFYGSTSGTLITNSYCAGEVGTTQTKPGQASSSTLGGFGGAGGSAAQIQNCYYDKQTSGMEEYVIGTTQQTAFTGIDGYLTGQMIGSAMQDELGMDNWVYQEGMYPQLKVFAEPTEAFGNETDRAIARAYSSASVCTALLQPSNLGKSQEELEAFGNANYDTVRKITVLFPLTNNEISGIGSQGMSIRWDVRPGYTCQVPGDMYGNEVIIIDPKTYQTTNFTPGVGWVDVSVDTGIVNPQNGANIVGQRFMRLVPTTVISMGNAESVSAVRYVDRGDDRQKEADVQYDHRLDVVFAAGEANQVDSGNIRNSAYPKDDETFGYKVTEDAATGEKKVELVGVELPSVASGGVGGKVVVVVFKQNPETGEFEEMNVATDENLQDLLLNRRHVVPEDRGVYRLEYRWYTAGQMNGGYITNSKTLTIRDSLKLSYDWNHVDHEEQSLIYEDDYPYTIGATVQDAKHEIPEDPATKGYTFMGWSTDPEADPDHFVPFTEETQLEDDTVVYAVWKINRYPVSIVKNGRGIISGTGSYPYGDDAKLTWQPEEGWYINYIMVDGIVRDDLLAENEFTFEAVEAAHTIYVEFGQDQNVVESEYYPIITKRTGGDASCMVSDSVSARPGEDATITWAAGDGYKVTKVLIDGMLIDNGKSGSYTFNGISRGHEVEVVFEKENTSTVNVVKGYSTINTSKTGSGTVTESASVENSGSYTVHWIPEAGNHVTKIVIDGVEITDAAVLNQGEHTFFPVGEDHTFEVFFEPDTVDPDHPTPPDPTAKTYTIETQITGGPGTITPTTVVEVSASSPEANEEIEWTTPDQRYKVKDVYVDGVSVKDSTDENAKVVFDEIDSDHTVLVVLEPNLFEVQTVIEGEGSITPGATLFWGEDYTVNYEAADGWKLEQIYIDEVAQIEYPEPEEPENPDEENKEARNVPQIIGLALHLNRLGRGTAAFAPEDQTGDADQTDVGPVEFAKIEQNHKVHVVFSKIDASGEEPDTVKHNVSTSLSGGIGSVTPGVVLEDGSQYTVEWNVAEGYEVESVTVKVNGIARDGMVAGNQVVIDDLSDDVEVNVVLRPAHTVNVPGATPPSEEDNAPTYDIRTSIEKGAGTISSSMSGVAQGSDQTIYWNFGDDSAIRTIYVDGVVRDDLLSSGQYTFSNITENHVIEIFIKEDPNGTGGVVDKESYRVITSMSGQGEISDSTTVQKGDSATVTWTPAEGWQVTKVMIDGAEKTDLLSENSLTFNQIGADHTIQVVCEKVQAPGEDPVEPSEQFTITTAMQGEGTISSSCTVEKGQDKTIRWSAKDGSFVAAVIVDGIMRGDLLQANQVAFNSIDSDHTVEVLFKEKTEKPDEEPKPDEVKYVQVKTSSKGQGTISGTKTMVAGSGYTVSWKAADGWKVAGILVDGMNVDSLATAEQLVFNTVNEDHTIQVIFVPADGSAPGPAHTIETDISGGEGTITATGEAPEEGDYTVTWEPKEGYEVDMVIIDGVEHPELVGAGSWTFKSVEGSHSIRVTMRPVQKTPDEEQGGTGVGTGDELPVGTFAVLGVSVLALVLLLILRGRKKTHFNE
ncbi:MAG: hypothetical protein HFE64_02265 [Lachnospiraceae bacterium]|jgi:hypothetical protein|nr:hypothetical protein [Lachnospiraceae bacterium]